MLSCLPKGGAVKKDQHMIALDAAELNQQVDEGLFIIEVCQRESAHMRDQVVPINYPIHPPIVNR